MSTVTWGVNAEGECSLFCYVCREVFARGLNPAEAKLMRDDLNHECKGRNSKEGVA